MGNEVGRSGVGGVVVNDGMVFFFASAVFSVANAVATFAVDVFFRDIFEDGRLSAFLAGFVCEWGVGRVVVGHKV